MLDNFRRSRGGLESWTARLADQLVDRGHDVHIVAGAFGQDEPPRGLTFQPVVGARPGLDFGNRAVPVLLELAPDVIHDMGCGWHCDVFQPHCGSRPAVAARKRAHWPFWMRRAKQSVDGLLRREREFRKLLALQYEDRGQTIVAVSDMVAHDLRQHHGVAPERIRTIPNGVDTEQFSPGHRARHRSEVRRRLGIPEGAVVALCVGHNFRLKGVPTLLAAVARMRAAGLPIHALVVGGERLDRWRWKARRMGIARHCTFAGTCADPVPYYAAADLSVHPARFDSFGLVLLEAAASGLPLIVSRSCGATELFRDGIDQHVLDDPLDADELAAAMRALIAAPARERMGASARRQSLEHTFERNVERIVSLYEEIADRRAGVHAAVGRSTRCVSSIAP